MAKQDMATKKDIEELAIMTETAIRTEVTMLREEIAEIRNEMLTKEEAKQFVTKHDLQDAVQDIKDEIRSALTNHEARITNLEARVKN